MRDWTMPGPWSRREWLAGTVGALGALALPGPGGAAAQGTAPARAAGAPPEDAVGLVTPVDRHFVHHRGSVPRIDAERYGLVVDGLVGRTRTLSLDTLQRLPRRSRICFLECASGHGDGPSGHAAPAEAARPVAQSEWTGVLVADLLREVEPLPGARWLLAEGADGASGPPLPLDRVAGEAMVAYLQNGEALRPEHGFPARLVVPGWGGGASVKWLRRLRLAAAPEGNGPPAEEVGVRSRVTSPAFPDRLVPGPVRIEGIAWSGRGRIARVEVSTDGGRSWTPVQLEEPVLPRARARFRADWHWDGGEAVLLSRATGETGEAQPGAGGAGWRVDPTGRVSPLRAGA